MKSLEQRRSPDRPASLEFVYNDSATLTASPQFSGGFVGKVTPVPIPNTEVKLAGADDTASFRCGKVGSRRIKFKSKKPAQSERVFCFSVLLDPC